MRTFRPPAMLCDRAREWASLRLDGELSELEGAMLDAHLERCAECRTLAAGVEAFTVELRAAPLVPIPRPLAIPRRRHAAFRAARVSAAAAVMLVAAGLGSVFATSVQTSAPGGEQLAVARAATPTDDRQLRDMRRAQLRIERALLQTNPRERIGNVT